jgi:Proteasome stabiliser
VPPGVHACYPQSCLTNVTLRSKVHVLVVVQVIVFGLRKNSTMRIKQTTMEFVVWVLKHASDEQMAAMTPPRVPRHHPRAAVHGC